jgi:ribosomal protein L37AE/L43A
VKAFTPPGPTRPGRPVVRIPEKISEKVGLFFLERCYLLSVAISAESQEVPNDGEKRALTYVPVRQTCRHCQCVNYRKTKRGVFWTCKQCGKPNPGPAMEVSTTPTPEPLPRRRIRERERRDENTAALDAIECQPAVKLVKPKRSTVGKVPPAPSPQSVVSPQPPGESTERPAAPKNQGQPMWRRIMGYED